MLNNKNKSCILSNPSKNAIVDNSDAQAKTKMILKLALLTRMPCSRYLNQFSNVSTEQSQNKWGRVELVDLGCKKWHKRNNFANNHPYFLQCISGVYIADVYFLDSVMWERSWETR